MMLNTSEMNLNRYYGRTKDELIRIGQFMHKEIVKKGNPLSISEEESILYVYIRVLDEIFIGMEREINTVKNLQKLFPNVTFLDVSIENDTKFSVDSELYVDKKLKLAIQIKSLNYQKDKQLIVRDTKKFNADKNDDYTKLKGVKVITVYSTEFGEIPDSLTIEKIRALLK